MSSPPTRFHGLSVVTLLAFFGVLLLPPSLCCGQAVVPFGSEFRVNTYTTGAQAYPAIAMDGTGDFVVVWVGPDGDGNGIFGQRYNAAGTPQGSEFRVNANTSGEQAHPDVARDSTGDFVVVWDSNGQDASGIEVFGRVYDPSGGPVASEFRVNSYTTDAQSKPHVANDSSGAFVVVWSSKNQASAGSGYDVYAQRYSSAASLLGPEFPVNTRTSAGQYAESVARGSSGFVITWESFGTANFDVFAQRYDA